MPRLLPRSSRARSPRRTTAAARQAIARAVMFEQLELRRMMAGNVFISEFMAANATSLLDQDAAASDWVELHNPTNATVNLDGYFLTDKKTQLNQWRIPAVSLAPNGYLTIFASGKN